jgi:hypothetical protein
MKTTMKMRNKWKSHLTAPVALMQLFLAMLLLWAAGTGGQYYLTVTEHLTSGDVPLPIFATTNMVGTTNYITNYLCINPSMTNSLTFKITPNTPLTNQIIWNFSGVTTPSMVTNTASRSAVSYSAMVTLKTNNFPTNLTPVTITSNRPNPDGPGLCNTTNQTVVMLLPDQITRDGNPINSTNNSVCVGQQINLTNIISGVPTNAITSYQWNIPGNTFKNYATNSVGQFTGVLSPLQTNDLAQPGVSFYWIDGQTNRVVSCQTVIYGQTNVVTANLNIQAPSDVSIDTSDTSGSAAVDRNYAYFLENPNATNSIAVHFGDGAITGAIFNANITPPSGYAPGHYVWIQLIGFNETAADGGTNYTRGPVTNVLDTVAPYIAPDTPFVDSPAVILPAGESGGFLQDQFTTYLMWEPSTPNAQYVPLKKVSWGWTGYGTYTAGNNWTSSNLSGPGTLPVSDATNHPTWSNNFTNVPWSPSNPP